MADKEDLERLIKLLKMTTAAEDNVKLVAIKKANEEVTKLGTDWESILRGKVKIIEDPFKNISMPNVQTQKAQTAAPRPASPPPQRQQSYTPGWQASPKPQPKPKVYGAYVGDSRQHPTFGTQRWDGNAWLSDAAYKRWRQAQTASNQPNTFYNSSGQKVNVNPPTNKVHVPPHKKYPPKKLKTGGKGSLDDALKDLL
jgi:hypothetical protein